MFVCLGVGDIFRMNVNLSAGWKSLL